MLEQKLVHIHVYTFIPSSGYAHLLLVLGHLFLRARQLHVSAPCFAARSARPSLGGLHL